MPVILRCSICNKVVGFCETPCKFKDDVPISHYSEIYGDYIITKKDNRYFSIIKCIECLI